MYIHYVYVLQEFYKAVSVRNPVVDMAGIHYIHTCVLCTCMCMYVCVCMYNYVCVHVHVRMYVCVYVYMYMYMYSFCSQESDYWHPWLVSIHVWIFAKSPHRSSDDIFAVLIFVPSSSELSVHRLTFLQLVTTPMVFIFAKLIYPWKFAPLDPWSWHLPMKILFLQGLLWVWVALWPCYTVML